MCRGILPVVVLTLVGWTGAGLCEERSVDANPHGMSGLFLMSRGPGAVSVPVKHAFKNPEPSRYSVRPKPEVQFLDLKLARAGGLFQPGGHIGLARNKYEKNNRGYHTHIYLKSEASQRLAKARAEHKTDVVLVINGVGKGRVEPITLSQGHWAVANMRSDGPGGYLTVTINTHIIIAWSESGQVPDLLNHHRQEVEYSLKEYIYQYFFQMGGSGIGGAIPSKDFARTGEIGASLYAAFIDSDDPEKALKHQGPPQSFSTMARSFRSNLPTSMQASVFRHVNEREFRRGLVYGRMPSWAMNESPDRDLYEKTLLTDSDPLIVARCFIYAPDKSVQTYRSHIVKSLNACFSQQQIPPYVSDMLFEKIANEKITECAPALKGYLGQSDDERMLDAGIKTLGELGALGLLGDLVMSKPTLGEKQLRRLFRYFRLSGLEDPEAERKAAVLTKLSKAAVDGQWIADADSRRALVRTMLSHVGPVGRSALAQERITQRSYRRVRAELYGWVDRAGGEEVLARLASANPTLDEIPLIIEGLKRSDLRTVAQCMSALSALEATQACPALLAVFDRADALNDLDAKYRSPAGKLMTARALPPADRNNLAYMADAALFHLAGGKENDIEPVPAYTSRNVLTARRAYWKRWIQDNRSTLGVGAQAGQGQG